jgi:hypothetical protein
VEMARFKLSIFLSLSVLYRLLSFPFRWFLAFLLLTLLDLWTLLSSTRAGCTWGDSWPAKLTFPQQLRFASFSRGGIRP